MRPVVFELNGETDLGKGITQSLNAIVGDFDTRQFPDGETYINVHSDVKDKEVIIIITLLEVDNFFLKLVFLSQTLMELGAKRIGLVAPYLSYMRQDIKFHQGEALTSRIFANLINQHFDWLVTVDPHLHRYSTLNEIYRIPNAALHAKDLLSDWIKKHLPNAYLIGPDEESEQWVKAVAFNADVMFSVAKKERYGDRNVKVTFKQLMALPNQPVVLVDDIISSGHTMLEAIGSLKQLGFEKIYCLAIHGIFANQIDRTLINEGATEIITTNSIENSSKSIDLSELISNEIQRQLGDIK
nr:ribose-phosphate diphosphokinase [Marinicella rhabdoformis]